MRFEEILLEEGFNPECEREMNRANWGEKQQKSTYIYMKQ